MGGEERGRMEVGKRENDISKQIATVNTHFSDFSDSHLGSEIFFFLTLPLIHFGILQIYLFSLCCT